MKTGIDKRISVLILLASVIIIVSIGVYHFTPGFNSDLVEGVFWADTSLRGGRLLNPGYLYEYALPFGSNILMMPFVHFLGITHMANCLGMFCFFILCLLTCIYFFKALTDDWSFAALGTALLLLAFRSKMGENLLHHVLPYQLGYVCFLGIYASLLHIMKNAKAGNKTNYKHCFGLLFYAVWSSANGIPTFMLGGFPVLVAMVLMVLLRTGDGGFKRRTDTVESQRGADVGSGKKRGISVLFQDRICWSMIGMTILGMVVGYGLYRFCMRGIQESRYLERVGSFNFLPIEQWITNLGKLPLEWIKLFMVHDPAGVRIMSVIGIETVISVVVAVVCVAVPVVYLVKLREMGSRQLFILIGCVVVWLECLVEYVFFREAGARMLYNGLCMNFLLLAVLAVSCRVILIKRKWLIVVTVAVLALFAVLFCYKANWTVDTTVVDEIENHNLDYGVSTFWNASFNTVNSEGRVEIRPIVLRKNGMTPRKALVETSWYDGSEDGKDWFILLTDEEYRKLMEGPDRELVEMRKDQFEIQGLRVLVYDDEMFEKLVHK